MHSDNNPFLSLALAFCSALILKLKLKTIHLSSFEPPYDKTNEMACASTEDSDQPGHPPSLIRVFAVRSIGS